MESNKQSATGKFRQLFAKPEYSSILMLVVMIVLAAILQRNFFRPSSLILTIDAFSPLILLTMGQAVVMLSGSFDLSSGAALSLYTCVLTWIMKTGEPFSGVVALLVTLVVAIIVGIINGFGAGYMRVSSVVVTFATSYVWLGIGLFIRPTPGGDSVNWFNAFYDFRNVEGVPQFFQKLGAFLPPVLLIVLLACGIWYVISRTKLGRYIYAVGGNEESAYRSGINTARVQIAAYVINSIFVFLAALFFVGQNQSGDARFGDPFTLRTIAAAVVGGIALTGGKGSVYTALVGAVIISLVNKVIFFANIPYAYGTLVAGLIVIVAIAGPQIYQVYNKRSAEIKRSPA